MTRGQREVERARPRLTRSGGKRGMHLAALLRSRAAASGSGEQRVGGANLVLVGEQHLRVERRLDRRGAADRLQLVDVQVVAQGDREQQPRGSRPGALRRARRGCPRPARAPAAPHRRPGALAPARHAADLEREQRVAERRVDDPAHERRGQAQAQPRQEQTTDRADAERTERDALQRMPLERLLEPRGAPGPAGEEKPDPLRPRAAAPRTRALPPRARQATGHHRSPRAPGRARPARCARPARSRAGTARTSPARASAAPPRGPGAVEPATRRGQARRRCRSAPRTRAVPRRRWELAVTTRASRRAMSTPASQRVVFPIPGPPSRTSVRDEKLPAAKASTRSTSALRPITSARFALTNSLVRCAWPAGRPCPSRRCAQRSGPARVSGSPTWASPMSSPPPSGPRVAGSTSATRVRSRSRVATPTPSASVRPQRCAGARAPDHWRTGRILAFDRLPDDARNRALLDLR